MKYSEARKILEKNGMELDPEWSTSRICILCHNDHVNPIVIFSKETCYLIDSYCGNNYATVNQMAIAQKVAYKLSRTKPEDREDTPKKYYLMILNLKRNTQGYLNKYFAANGRNKYITTYGIDSNSNNRYFQTQFTDAEIKQMQKDPIFENIELEKCKEPVEEK